MRGDKEVALEPFEWRNQLRQSFRGRVPESEARSVTQRVSRNDTKSAT